MVSPANQERRELNRAIRQELIARGHIDPQGRQHTIFISRGLSGLQRAVAVNYEPNDVVRFVRGSKQFGIAKGSYARVEDTDRDANLLVVNTADRRRVQYNPVRLFGVEVFREERRVLAQGDRIQFRAPDHALGVANGDFASIETIDDRRAVLRLDNGGQLSAALDRLRHIDYGYASTSHSAQGATVDRVIVGMDTQLSPELVNRKQYYVSISRAKNAVSVYTDDRSQLGRAAARSREKSLALERSARNQGFTVIPDSARRERKHSYGIRR